MITIIILFAGKGTAKEKAQMIIVSAGIDCLYILPHIKF